MWICDSLIACMRVCLVPRSAKSAQPQARLIYVGSYVIGHGCLVQLCPRKAVLLSRSWVKDWHQSFTASLWSLHVGMSARQLWLLWESCVQCLFLCFSRPEGHIPVFEAAK